MAVDESASLAAEDVRREIEAAATIAQSGLNPRTRVTVLGFGSSDGDDRKAVTQYCRPTVVATAAQLQYLSDCVRKLHRRTDAEGNDTDHVAAIAEALRVLRSGSPSGSVKTVFVLTDGRLDVADSPAYGRPGERDAEARRRLAEQLRTARQEGVRISPLGFGPEVDQDLLDRLASGGAQRACDDRAQSRPRARRVRDSRQMVRSLVEAYAAASCLRVSPPAEARLRPGGTVELPLDIPGTASEATFTVAKGDRRAQVEFVTPDGRPAPTGGSRDRSAYTRSGAGGTIEALRVTGPLNGRWRIRITAPDGVPALRVGATAMYQGVIRSRLVVEPPAVRTGERTTVRLSLVTRRGYVQDPKELQGLLFTVTATGAGLGGGQAVPMRDDGRAPDDTPGDGSYAGTFTAPAAPGRVTLTGTVAGAGLRSDGNPTATIDVTARPPDVQGVVAFPDGTSAHPGGAVRGTVQVHNSTPRTVRGRLVLNAPPQAQATVTPNRILTIPPGGSTHDFAIRFGGRAALGRASVTLRMTDESDPAKVYVTRQSAIEVEEPPGWLERNSRVVLACLALVAAVVAVLWLRRFTRRAWTDVRGLRVALHRHEAVPDLRPPRSMWSDEFRFVIRDLGGQGGPGLDRAGPGDKALVASRTWNGRIAVRTADGTGFEVAPGEVSEPLAGGLRLVFRDERGSGGLVLRLLVRLFRPFERGGRGATPRSPEAGPPKGGTTDETSAPPPSPPESPPPQPVPDDDWL